MTKHRVMISLDQEDLDRIDELAGAAGMTRSGYIVSRLLGDAPVPQVVTRPQIDMATIGTTKTQTKNFTKGPEASDAHRGCKKSGGTVIRCIEHGVVIR